MSLKIPGHTWWRRNSTISRFRMAWYYFIPFTTTSSAMNTLHTLPIAYWGHLTIYFSAISLKHYFHTPDHQATRPDYAIRLTMIDSPDTSPSRAHGRVAPIGEIDINISVSFSYLAAPIAGLRRERYRLRPVVVGWGHSTATSDRQGLAAILRHTNAGTSTFHNFIVTGHGLIGINYQLNSRHIPQLWPGYTTNIVMFHLCIN
jgi:hypothetical protein